MASTAKIIWCDTKNSTYIGATEKALVAHAAKNYPKFVLKKVKVIVVASVNGTIQSGVNKYNLVWINTIWCEQIQSGVDQYNLV